MTDTIEIHINHAGEAHLVGRCRYVAKRRGQSAVFEYADEWLDNPDAFAAGLQLESCPPRRKSTRTHPWISEEGPDADLDIARRAAPYFALKDDHAEAVISEVSAALKGWQNTARQLGMSAADIAVYATAIQSDA